MCGYGSGMKRLWYCNPWFDAALAGPVPERVRAQRAEMELWFVLVAQGGDVVLCSRPPPGQWLSFLEQAGFDLPHCRSAMATADAYHFVPWGWGNDAFDASRLAGCSPPPFTEKIIRNVNSRRFSYQLARRNGWGVCGAHLCQSQSALDRVLEAGMQCPFVVKPEYGNAGRGFVHCIRGSSQVRAKERCRALLREGMSCVVVEPWLNRCGDYSVSFTVKGSLPPRDRALYCTITTSGGAFYGVRLPPRGVTDPTLDPWRKTMLAVASKTAHALYEAGYRGPATIDALVAKTPQGDVLVPLLEINARYAMSRICRRVQSLLAPDRYVLFRTIATGRTRLPATYPLLHEMLRGSRFDAQTRSGAVVLTPLLLADGSRPHRTMVFCAARTRHELDALDAHVTRCINRPSYGGSP